MRRDLVVTTLCLLVVLLGLPALAEVRAITDEDGDYMMTRVLLAGRADSVWTPMARSEVGAALNPMGDRRGDLWPTIVESNTAPFHPWVVWSRMNVAQYDLAWSRWTEAGWKPTEWVAEDQNLGDDLDADVSFSEDGRPHVVWWRDEGGTGRIYLSLFLQSAWMQPYAVSELGVDARFPSIVLQGPNGILVHYETDEGTAQQYVLFDGTVAITDDINPLDYVYNYGNVKLVDD